jgi:hypothetical protein
VPDTPTDSRSATADLSYAERLWVPLMWWALGALFALSLLVAVLFYLGPAVGLSIGAGVMLVIAAMFVVYGREQIRVTDDRLWVGRANVEWRFVSEAKPLDRQATRDRRGPQADARAYLVLRPYLSQAVEITLDDEDDATPYWLINTRSPQRLATAIQGRLGDRGADPRDTLKS